MHGVKRVMFFCLMVAILPTILIITPLYLRHYVFANVTYPVAESDVMAIQDGVSSIFCDSIILTMSSSFNSFQLVGTPKITGKRKHIRLKKSMSLPDDTIEYWGFFLLKGALVRLKVCSRFDGSRLLVVRGNKNLDTCGLMEHKLYKKDTNLDVEHSRIKVTFEKPAEVLGMIDFDMDLNTAKEDTSDDFEPSLLITNTNNSSNQNNVNNHSSENNGKMKKQNIAIRTHRKRHVKRWQQKVKKLKNILENENIEKRQKRSIETLDLHIKHGGNAMNATNGNDFESESVSSFENDLLTCYDGRILVTRGFLPSRLCNDAAYLEQSGHMVTEHLVASDGYYYYIFYSDNDFLKNDIHAVFDIYKPTYRFADSSSRECINKTYCEFPLSFMGDEVVIVEVPTRDGIEHEADDITFLMSTCKPRTSVYIIFPILVLFLIICCAFM